MKITFQLVVLLTAATALAQTPPNTNAIVQCYPTNTAGPNGIYVGNFTNYPSSGQVTWTSATTLTAPQLASTNPVFLLILNAAPTIISDMQGSNAVAYSVGVSNANWTANLPVFLANSNLIWFFNNFPAGITDTGNRLITSSNDLASWTTGTNSAAQTNQIILRMLQDRKVSWIYENNIIQVLSTLSTLLTNQFQANGSH